MEAKSWYLSKTIWAGIIGIVIAVYNALVSALAANCGVEGSICIIIPSIPNFVYGILAALGIYGRASASTVIK